ncbi:MAG TPA: GNAT family N-acetyltransferase [Thermodesulfobacteriota bacterium]|nr:GNAT family N-acetyltransferase [Thermodesulfobacteriota bacterium]
MEITFREDINPNPDFYYRQQFKIYHEPYLIWDKETWEAVITVCHAYRIEIDGRYGGDVLLEDRGKGIKYIVDFSILPEHQGKGIGKTVLEQIKAMSEKLTAVTRKETLHFFLKSGFVLKRTVKNYYRAGLAGYYMTFVRRPDRGSLADGEGQSMAQREMLTLRKGMAKALEKECLDLREISKLFGMKEGGALDHLKHTAKSLHPKRLTVEPASCKHYGFSFKKRTRLNSPGRCPVCKSEHIFPPRFKIGNSSELRR